MTEEQKDEVPELSLVVHNNPDLSPYRAHQSEDQSDAVPPPPSRGQKFCGSAVEEEDVSNCLFACRAITSPDPKALLESEHQRHTLQLPSIEVDEERGVLMAEGPTAIYVAFKPSTDLRGVLEHTNLLPTFRYGGCLHSGFWSRAKAFLESSVLTEAKEKASQNSRTIFFTGYSTGGAVAFLCGADLLHRHFPEDVQRDLSTRDRRNEAVSKEKRGEWKLQPSTLSPDRFRIPPEAFSSSVVTFGAPSPATREIHALLMHAGVSRRFLSIVNEGDYIPGILNVSNTSALLANSSEKVAAIHAATRLLARQIVPNSWHRAVYTGRGGGAAGAYMRRSLFGLSNIFRKLGDEVDRLAPNYSPCGEYCFLSEGYLGSWTVDSLEKIEKQLSMENKALAGKNIVRHLLSTYTENVLSRMSSAGLTIEMNYYERLKVPRNASTKTITRGYRKVALRWHPDRWSNASPAEKDYAEKCFKLAAEAYETLSDPVARKEYDARLKQGQGVLQEFVKEGTIGGMTLDRAVALFAEVVESMSSVSGDVISTSQSSLVAHSHRLASSAATSTGGPALSGGEANFIPDNHSNIFAPHKMKIIRPDPSGGGAQKVLYVEPDELLPGDIAASGGSAQGVDGTASQPGIRGMALLGGAVAVGAGVSLAVSAWSNLSAAQKKRSQAEVIRTMPDGYLPQLLLESEAQVRPVERDTKLLTSDGSKLPTDQAVPDEKHKNQGAALIADQGSSQALILAKQSLEEDDAADIAEFQDALEEFGAAELEANAEEEFYECLEAEAILDQIEQQAKQEMQDGEQSTEVSVQMALSLADYDDEGTASAPLLVRHMTREIERGEGRSEESMRENRADIEAEVDSGQETDQGQMDVYQDQPLSQTAASDELDGISIDEGAFVSEEIDGIDDESLSRILSGKLSAKEKAQLKLGSLLPLLPPGVTVSTPFGVGTLLRTRKGSDDAPMVCIVRLGRPKIQSPPLDMVGAEETSEYSGLEVNSAEFPIAYLQEDVVNTGTSLVLTHATSKLQKKREEILSKVLQRYRLDDHQISADGLWDTMRATGAGAMDSGIKAAGGVVLAKGAARVSTRLAGSAAAPLTVASMLVDVGKEYWSYRAKRLEKTQQGALSAANDRVMMTEFRHKAGHHLFTGISAAVGAYAGTSLVAASMAGPVGLATLAIAGGLAGYYMGHKYYQTVTVQHFNMLSKAKEEVEALEVGARVLFDEFDQQGQGIISMKDCREILRRLQEATKGEDKEEVLHTLHELEERPDEEDVSWPQFFQWVSSEAVKKLDELEVEATEKQMEEAAKVRADFASWSASIGTAFLPSSWGWRKRGEQITSGGSVQDNPTSGTATMYPGVFNSLGYRKAEDRTACVVDADEVSSSLPDPFDQLGEHEGQASREVAASRKKRLSVIEAAQIDTLVEQEIITEADADSLRLMMLEDEEKRRLARLTVENLLKAQERDVFL